MPDPLPLFEVSLHILNLNGEPAIQLRKETKDQETIRNLIMCAYHQKPILILPKFRDRITALNALIEKGIIRKEGEQYIFNI